MDFSRTHALTFDCYGTLVDWELGILTALRHLVPQLEQRTDDELLSRFAAEERRLEEPPFRPYRQVLSDVAVALAEASAVRITPTEAAMFAASVPEWPPFAETRAALQRLAARYRLAVLSNVDRDLFAGTAAAIGVAFDVVVTAEDVASYKPHFAHFERGLSELGLERHEVVHVAESLRHDIVPARALGIPCVWVHRQERQRASGDPRSVRERPDLTVTSLTQLADLALR